MPSIGNHEYIPSIQQSSHTFIHIDQQPKTILIQHLNPPEVIHLSIMIHLLSSNLQPLKLELFCPTTSNIPLEPYANSSNKSHQPLQSNKYTQQHKSSTGIDAVTIKVTGCLSATCPGFPLAGPAVEGFILAEPCWVIRGR